MLIYIHVPFCRTRCKYCAFNSEALGKGVAAPESPRFRHYVDSIFMELAIWGERYPQVPVTSVFFGGGTPSLMPPKAVSAILSRISKYFKLSPGAEITLESNPESLSSRGLAYEFLRAGVNRFSIGLQSIDEEMLRVLGRSHKARDSMHAVYSARDAGAQNISVDLMWGLPGQGVRHWLNTLKEVARMKPDHLSCYALTPEPGTQLYEECEQGLITLPTERDQSVMYMEGGDFLESMGYLHYEISNFARMGFQCRHNLGYWEGEEYLGVGPSATSTIGGRRWTNPASLFTWMDAIDERSLDANAEELTNQARVLELVMLRLRTARGMRVRAYRELTGRDFFQDHKQLVRALHENGLIRIRDGYLRLTRSGMLVSNSILANIFEQAGAKLLPEPHHQSAELDAGTLC